MASNCEDVSAQMMELLYGELPADARASVDAHVAGCARCRAELDGFEKTRAVARSGLDEAPPARARAAIMQAAAAHLAAQAQAQPAARAGRHAREGVVLGSAPVALGVPDARHRRRGRGVHGGEPRVPEPGAHARAAARGRSAVGAGGAALSGPALAQPRWTGEPPELDRNGPASARDRARGPRDDESRAHHGEWADGDLRGAGKKMKKGEDAERELAERPGAKGGARAEEKPKRDRDEPAENKFAPPPPPRDGTPAGHPRRNGPTRRWRRARRPRRRSRRPPGLQRPRESRRPRRLARPAQAQGSLDDLLAGESQRRARRGGTASGKGALGGLAGPQSKADSYGSGAGAAQPAPATPRPTSERDAPAGVRRGRGPASGCRAVRASAARRR